MKYKIMPLHYLSLLLLSINFIAKSAAKINHETDKSQLTDALSEAVKACDLGRLETVLATLKVEQPSSVDKLIKDNLENAIFYCSTRSIEVADDKRDHAYLPIVKKLLSEYKGDINELVCTRYNFIEAPRIPTLVFIANSSGYTELCSLLIDAKCDVNAPRIDFCNGKWESGSTPLHAAAWYGRINLIKILLIEGANKDIKIKNRSEPFCIIQQALAYPGSIFNKKPSPLIPLISWGCDTTTFNSAPGMPGCDYLADSIKDKANKLEIRDARIFLKINEKNELLWQILTRQNITNTPTVRDLTLRCANKMRALHLAAAYAHEQFLNLVINNENLQPYLPYLLMLRDEDNLTSLQIASRNSYEYMILPIVKLIEDTSKMPKDIIKIISEYIHEKYILDEFKKYRKTIELLKKFAPDNINQTEASKG